MADFNPNARERIKSTVRAYEAGVFSGRGPIRGAPGAFGHNVFLARSQATVLAGNLANFKIMFADGTSNKGDEQDGDQYDDTLQAWVRTGLVFEGQPYHLLEVGGGDDTVLDVQNPTLRFRGMTAEAIVQDALGDVDVYQRSSDSGYTSAGKTVEALNDLDVDIDAAGAVCEVIFDGLNRDSGEPRWRILNTDFACPPE